MSDTPKSPLPCPVQREDGKWEVGEEVFDTNAKAWRWIDLQENALLNRQQDVADWVFGKMANGE